MTVTAYYTNTPAETEVLFIVDGDGSHHYVPLATKGDLSSCLDAALSEPMKLATLAPSSMEDLAAYLTAFQARVSAPPAPLTPAEKLAAAGLTVEELKGLLA